jgi:hypothetical protein
MKKIPTIFKRDHTTLKHNVTQEINPDCQWVFDGEGIATYKYDGTCVMYDGKWWARREVKPGKIPPPGYLPLDFDHVTGKQMGWEPIEQSPFFKCWVEAVGDSEFEHGTYELLGPKIQGNPEKLDRHLLVSHNKAPIFDVERTYSGILAFLFSTTTLLGYIEGLVFKHPDGRMAKIKYKDFLTD